MGRGITPKQGGGAGGGQVTVPGTRPQIARERVKVTNKTVGEGLVDTLSALNDQQIAQFGDVLRSAAREADAGDVRATQTYALALNKLAAQGVPGLVQWKKIVNASGMAPAEFSTYFQELSGPPRPNRDVSDAEAMQMAEDAPPVSNQQILAENMPQEGVAPGSYDPSSQLADAVGGELSAQGMPVVERDPMVSPHSWAHILGSSEAAERTRLRGRVPNASMMLFPQLARYDNIRFLAQQTGLPFQAVVGAPQPKGVVKQAFDMIDAARNPDGSPAVAYDFDRKNQMRPSAEQVVAEDVMADEKIPPDMKQRVIADRVQQLLDRMPAATYPDDLGPRLKELLMAGDQPDPAAPAPVYQGSDFDPVAAQAALDNEADSLPETTDYGLGWKRDMYLDPDTNLLGSMPVQNTSPLARLIATGNENAVPAFV
ncbi:MAG: hypothetical protein EBS50_10380, partial [Sphingomonadaceae bacterium]|nr:hypothetical protein [Sphingomonadaceae bacterium]